MDVGSKEKMLQNKNKRRKKFKRQPRIGKRKRIKTKSRTKYQKQNKLYSEDGTIWRISRIKRKLRRQGKLGGRGVYKKKDLNMKRNKIKSK